MCDEAREVVAAVAAEVGAAWSERDVTASSQDLREYGDMVPVALVDGVQVDFWHIDAGRLRRALGA